MTQLNEVGDVVLTEPRAMLALADRSRLTLHDALRRGGPATASDLAPLLGLQPQEILKHLEALEGVGLVERSQARAGNDRTKWAAIGKGVYFEIPEDAEGQRAARQLSNAMFLQYADLPRRWVDDHEPHLALTWTRAAGMLNVGLLISPDELRDIQSAFEGVLEPYLTRQEDRAPKEASRVRLLSYFMPESPEQERP